MENIVEEGVKNVFASSDPKSKEAWLDLAEQVDNADVFKDFRDSFNFPPTSDEAKYRTPGSRSTYFCGNSLGLQSTRAKAYMLEEIDNWGHYAVGGHFKKERPWTRIDESVAGPIAKVVGAKHESEVVVMNFLTVNLHLLLAGFYRPEGKRNKILMEHHAFPSDTYAAKSQILQRNLNSNPVIQYPPVAGEESNDGCLIEVRPRDNEELLNEDDIIAAMEKYKDDIAIVLWPGIQYYTGQYFDHAKLAKKAHEIGALYCVDLAHAVGNVPLHLHDWNVDFASWCSYKYLNSGPGGVSGIFVHSNLHDALQKGEYPHFAGWWGNEKSTRFKMASDFERAAGAPGFQLSNNPPMLISSLRGSLELFDMAGGVDALRDKKSIALTAFLEYCLETRIGKDKVSIITPKDRSKRGCQLSICFVDPVVRPVYNVLLREGVIVDIREPRVMRVAPAPIYNNAKDVVDFVDTLLLALREVGVSI